MSNNIEKIREFLLENFFFDEDDSDLDNDDSFLEQGIIDSTGILELVDWLGETFSITVDETEITPENLDSVNLIAAYIKRKQG